MPVRAVVERGPKGQRAAAFALDWPGWSRGAKTPEAALERGIAILQACWAYFDAVAARVSAEMRKGPRGGGRDRDRIVRHTIRTESEDFAKQVGLRIPEEAALTPDGLRQHRESYVAAMRAYNAGDVERRMRSWTLPYLVRHSAFHTLDHAWEMEDKDLSA